MTQRFQHHLETVLPLQSSDGRLEVSGWCWLEGATQAPEVKLISDRGVFQIARRKSRPDVAAAFNLPGDGDLWGFVLSGELPAGAHQLTLAAAAAGTNEWQTLRRFTAVVFSRGLQASIEFPPEATIRESVRIQGWAAHPEETIRDVALHYGTRRVPCEFGLPRGDVTTFFPGAPDAAKSGFITVKNAPAGRGAIRVVAIDSEGARQVARIDCFANINP